MGATEATGHTTASALDCATQAEPQGFIIYFIIIIRFLFPAPKISYQ